MTRPTRVGYWRHAACPARESVGARPAPAGRVSRPPKEQTLPGNLSGIRTAWGQALWKASHSVAPASGPRPPTVQAAHPGVGNSQVHDRAGRSRPTP
ncbi:hypothetical protein MICRO11B_280029 [Micrococcus luteus]|nr:hypothetical protein MICRO11B_280029 [Micrococcus luteus]